MKKLFFAFAALVLSASIMSAQDDLAEATETYNKGVTTLQSGNTAEALSLFEEALALGEYAGEEGAELVANCKNVIPGLIVSMAKSMINEDNYDGAIEKLQQAIAKADEYDVQSVADEAAGLITNAYLRKGATQVKAKDYTGAAASLNHVVEADPANGQAYLLLGQALVQGGGSTEEAIGALQKASENGKADQAAKLLGNIYLKEGSALLKDGKTEEAIAAFVKSNEYSENANAYKMLANAYNKLSDKSNAISAAKKYLELSPSAKDAATYKQLIEVLSK